MEAEADFILVSDFHLAAGESSPTGNGNGREEFFSDAPFAHLLDALLDRARKETRRWRLVLLGDVFDFLRVRLKGGKITLIDTSVQAAGQRCRSG